MLMLEFQLLLDKALPVFKPVGLVAQLVPSYSSVARTTGGPSPPKPKAAV
jgi:hypothetical protein